MAKFHRRTPGFTVVGAFVLTLIEAVLALVMVRFVFRMLMRVVRRPATLLQWLTLGFAFKAPAQG